MSLFYEINPLDTLFFRGSTPMEAGQNASVSLFPPPVSVFEGAVRTEVLKQKNVDAKKYASLEDPSLNNLIGNPGEKPPFDVTAILVKKNGRYYAKAPATWYFDYDEEILKQVQDDGRSQDDGHNHDDGRIQNREKIKYLRQKIISARNMNEELAALSVQGSEENVPFVRAEKNLQPLGNIWVSLEFLKSGKNQFAENDFLLQSEICDFENRTGVALDENKHTVEGQLYSSSHVRLLDGVALIFALSKDAGLLDKGKILLGGEKRVSLYKKITEDLLAGFSFDSDNFLSLAPIRAAEEILKSVVASGKLEITSGWDLTKGFHKPTESWIPAGAVFTKNINGTCVPLKKI